MRKSRKYFAEDIAQIMAMQRSGVAQEQICGLFGVSHNLLCKMLLQAKTEGFAAFPTMDSFDKFQQLLKENKTTIKTISSVEPLFM